MKKLLSVLFVGVAVLLSAQAADYPVTVPAGTTNVIDAAFVEALGSAERLVKRGTGVLQSSALMANYKGEIVVEEGVLLIKEGSSLGTSAGCTTVSNGASIVMNMATAANYKAEEFKIAGEGAAGEGGAFVNLGASMTGSLSYFTLLDDARLYAWGEAGLYAGRLNMNGHTLTIAVRNKQNGQTTWQYSFNFTRSRVTNPGHIVLETGRLSINGRTLSDGTAVWDGDGSNTLTLKRGTKLMLSNSLTYVPWTLIAEDVSGIYTSGDVDAMAPTNNAWSGPVVLQGTPSIGYQTNKGSLSFGGEISGVGSLSWSGCTPVHLWAASSYTGSTTANGANASDAIPLYLHAGKTLPVNNPNGLKLINGNLPLLSDEAYELPVIRFTNDVDRTISGGAKGGTMAGLVKSGAGTLTYDTSVDVTGTVHLVQGRVVWPVRSIREQVGGVMQGECNFDSDAYQAPGANYYWSNYSRTYPEVSRKLDSVHYAYTTKQPLWASKYAMARYEGYIWNDSDENVTWSFMSGVQNRGRMYINGTQLFDQNSYQRAAFKQAVLKPGANKFVFSIFFAPTTNGGGGGSTLTQVIDFDGTFYQNPLDNSGTEDFKWTLLKGCAYNPNGTTSHDEKDYLKFENLADGKLMTITDNFTGMTPVARAGISNLVVESGAALDLADPDCRLTVETISGEGTVENGLVQVESKWILRADQVGSGTLTFAGSAPSFGEDAVIDVDDVAALDKSRHVDDPYVIATTDGTFASLPEVGGKLLEKRWRVRLSDDTKSILLYRDPAGMMMILR